MAHGMLPEVPDPTKIAQSGVEAVKSLVNGGINAGIDLADGFRKILVQSVEGGATEVDQTVKSLINMAKANLDIGKSTFESVRRDIDSALTSVISQVDKAIGGEIVRKFKSEVEKRLR